MMRLPRRKRERLLLLLGGGLFLAAALALTLNALRDSIVYFHGPGEVISGAAPVHRAFRLGGLVKTGSLETMNSGGIRFLVTDLDADVPVVFNGLPPDLFREGQGVVALGRLDDAGLFHAQEVLARHDENYMPAEAVEALKRAGTWRAQDAAAPPAAR